MRNINNRANLPIASQMRFAGRVTRILDKQLTPTVLREILAILPPCFFLDITLDIRQDVVRAADGERP